MPSRKLFRCSALFILVFGSCLLITGCKKKISKTELLSLTENAVLYEYSDDNIFSLESIIIDSDKENNRIIFGFNDDSEFISQDIVKDIIEKMKNDPNSFEMITGESVGRELNNDIEAIYSDGSVYIILKFEAGIECINCHIRYSGCSIDIDSPWSSPALSAMKFNVQDNGDIGDMLYIQTYDKDTMKWNIYDKVFGKNVPPDID